MASKPFGSSNKKEHHFDVLFLLLKLKGTRTLRGVLHIITIDISIFCDTMSIDESASSLPLMLILLARVGYGSFLF